MTTKSPGPGRPKMTEDEKQIKTAVSLTRELADFASAYGGGMVSRGVKKALAEAQARAKRRK